MYLANVRFPTEKAHGVQIAKMCEAFADAGHDVELVVTNRPTSISEDAYSYYSVRKNFSIIRVPVPDIVSWGGAGFFLESFWFAVQAAKLVRKRGPDVIYSRDEVPLSFLSSVPYVWETHTGSWNVFSRHVAARARHIVSISQGLKEFYVARGVSVHRILVAHDGIDLEPFARAEPKVEARRRLGLPLDKAIALYVGRLDGWKGVQTLFQAAELVQGVCVGVIGGSREEVSRLQAQYPAVHFLGERPYRELSDNLSAADVLILPNTGKSVISTHYTSPLKLFAYMASDRPIIASDLPSIREVLDDASAYFVRADEPEALAKGILTALTDSQATNKSRKAMLLVNSYSWRARAKRVISTLETQRNRA